MPNRTGNKKIEHRHPRKATTGFEQTLTCYKAQNCRDCPLRWGCHKAKSNRLIEINHNLEMHKQVAREKLLSDEGVKCLKKRDDDVDTTSGIIKHNKGFRRFLLRGKSIVEIEIGLIALEQFI